jgi:ribonuclease VapC
MMIDTSAIFALIAGEPEAPRFRDATLAASSVSVSAVSLLEVRTVLHGRLGTASVQHFEVWLAETGATVLPFDREQADAAFDAFRQSGKGQGHPAQLNFGDCASYAAAKTRGDALLFKGNDFERTDIASAG